MMRLGARQAAMLVYFSRLARRVWLSRRELEEVADCPSPSSATWALRALESNRWVESKTLDSTPTSPRLYRLRKDLSAAKREKLNLLLQGEL